MTEDGSPYDNAVAERINGILFKEGTTVNADPFYERMFTAKAIL
jgi:hypothetical protein